MGESTKMEVEETSMDTSIGSDGERSGSSFSDASAASPPVTPTDARLKFSIANILSPHFGRANAVSDAAPFEEKALVEKQKSTFVRDLAAAQKLAGMGLAAAAAATAAPWPAWVFCTRYSDRPSSGPRCRRVKPKELREVEEKRPRTAFTGEQLNRLKAEFQENRYLTEKRRHELAHDLGLNESQIKIWFQNKRAKIKKLTGARNPLAFHLMAQGLYNHSTVPVNDVESTD